MTPKKTLLLPLTVLAAAALATAPVSAQSAQARPTAAATPEPSVTGLPAPLPSSSPIPSSSASPTPTTPAAPARYFSAVLSGADEIAADGSPAAGDPNGSGDAVVEISGDTVTFGVSWHRIGPPTMAHLHAGSAGTDGTPVVPLFESALPDTATAAAGTTSVDDASLVQAIETDPAGYYLNVHTADFPDGAIRGQLHALRRAVDPLDVLGGLPLQAVMDGGQEAAGGSPAGAPGAHGTGLIRASGTHVDYALDWSGISAPTMAHIHAGGPDVSGPVVVPLFTTPVPAGITALAGKITGVTKKLATDIRTDPGAYYTNVHTTEFPAGAIRGQLFRAGHLS